MRPKQLTMTAFGPYGEKQVIDFEKLTDSNIFLIHGPTGAGKTTILDAMCYALYGYTNGGERSAESMRSKFARPEQGAEVELIFTVLGKEYKIFRSPRFERPKLKGTGTTEQLPKVSLSEWDGEKFITVSEKQTDIDRKISELLKFNIDQFRQVIMIAQNKFRELLTVDSKERQKILQDIFETRMYEEIEQKLDAMTSKLAEELKVQEVTYHTLLSNIEDEEDEILKQYIVTKVLKNAPQVVAILNEKCTMKNELQKVLEAELVQIKEHLEELQKGLIEQTEKYNALIQKQEVEKEIEAIHSQTEHYIGIKKQVEWSQKAEKLVALEENTKELEVRIVATTKLIDKLKLDLDAINLQLDNLTENKSKFEQKLPYIEQIKKQYSILETYVPKVKELAANEQVRKALFEHTMKYEKLISDKVSKIQKGKEYIETAEKKIAHKERLTKELGDIKLYKQQVEQVLLIKQDIENKGKELVSTRAKYSEISAEIKALRNREDTITSEYNTLFELWLQNQAGEISKVLDEGSPCPVCGSTVHPQKAVITHTHIDLDEIRKKEQDKLQINGAISQKLEEQNNIKEAGIRLRTEEETLKVRAKELHQNYEDIELSAQAEIMHKINGLQDQIDQINKDQELMNEYKIKVVNLEKDKEKLEQELKVKQIEVSQLSTKIEEVQNEIPANLHTDKALNQKLEALKSEYLALEQEGAALSRLFEQSKGEQTRLQVSLQEKTVWYEETMKQKAQKQEMFDKQLMSSGFESLVDYHEAKKQLSQVESMRQSLEAYDRNKAICENTLKELTLKTKDFNVETLEITRTQYEQISVSKDEGQVKHNKLIDYINKHQKVIKEIEALYKKSMEVIRRQHTIGTVTSLAKGKNSKGLSFERYIQSSIFEQVLKSANNKLKPMTGSRYELYREGDRQDKRKQAGLDIAVKDNYVGQTRPVSTLSGGESFMAALALALGLSEVIQRLAGATSLDTMFIDEGFGTLDEEALELAIKTLLNLGDTGRLVGIISHVKELREQIPARLEIIATNTGSRAEFKI